MPVTGLPAELLRAVLDATRLLVLVADDSGCVVASNQEVERVTGLPASRLRGPIWDLAELADERAGLKAVLVPLRPEKLPASFLFHLITAEGGSRVVDWDLRLTRDARGAPIVAFVGLDLTARLAAEKRLRDDIEIQRFVFDQLPAVVWTTDRELRVTMSKGGALKALGLASGQVETGNISLFGYLQTNDPEHPGIAPHLRALRGETAIFDLDWLGRNFHCRVDPLHDRAGEIVGTVGVALDITESVAATAALRAHEAQLRRLVDSNVIGIMFWDEAGQVTQANDAVLALLGFDRSDLASGSIAWNLLTPPEYRQRDEHALAELRATGRCKPYEKELWAKDGSRVPVLVGGASLEPVPGEPLRGITFIVDMREQIRLRKVRDELLARERAARQESERANARLMLLVEGGKRLARCLTVIDTIEMLAALVVPALADWSYVVHCDVSGGPMLIASAHSDVAKLPLLRRLHGCRPDFAAPEGAPRVFRTGEVALYQDITDEQLGVGDSRGWPIVGTRDPSTLQILRELGMKSLLCVPIRGRTGVDAVLMLASATNPRRYDPDDIAMATDLADRAAISLENGRLLLEAREALRARDEFIAVAAHELRTPLTSLMLQLQLLGHAIERDEISRDVLRHGVATAEEHGRVLTTLADRLLEATSLPTYALRVTVEKVELRSLLDEVVARLGRQLERARCTLSMSVPPGIIGQWDRARLAQVFDALLSNALKFGAGRPIEIAAMLADGSVAVSVCDHGVGIAREDQARIFERFERAAPMRHFGGLGLGLYMAAKIVSSLGGSIRVESEPGKGACFIVQLPLAAPDRRANSDVMFPSRAGAT